VGGIVVLSVYSIVYKRGTFGGGAVVALVASRILVYSISIRSKNSSICRIAYKSGTFQSVAVVLLGRRGVVVEHVTAGCCWAAVGCGWCCFLGKQRKMKIRTVGRKLSKEQNTKRNVGYADENAMFHTCLCEKE
jgi:hypothetical protein